MVMSAQVMLEELKALGQNSYKKVLLNHGIKEPVFGVKVEHLKKFQKKIKKDYQLALDLYDTGVYDAMYLAGLIADDGRMTAKDLQRWVERANCASLCDYTVAWVAAGSQHGWEMARKWIESKKEAVATAGWATFGHLVALTDDADLDLDELTALLDRVRRTIHDQPNRVRYVMNGFVIAVGSYVQPLTDLAVRTAKQIGPVSVDVGDTACKVPDAAAYIEKVRQKGRLGQKKKTVKC
jgi:3-methyladenine DNA glycosylase AlkD